MTKGHKNRLLFCSIPLTTGKTSRGNASLLVLFAACGQHLPILAVSCWLPLQESTVECCRLQAVKRKAVGSINESGACAIGGRWHCQKEEHAPPMIYGRPTDTLGRHSIHNTTHCLRLITKDAPNAAAAAALSLFRVRGSRWW